MMHPAAGRLVVIELAYFKEQGLMLRMVCLLSSVGMLWASMGCVTAAKQAFYGVTGSQGSFYEIQVADPQVLAQFDRIRVEPFGNELGAHVPAKVIAQLQRQTADELADSELFDGDGRELVVRGSVVHFTGQSGLVGSIDSVVGGGDVCVCRIRLVDGANGQTVGEGVCWGEVKSAIRRGSKEYGEGVARGLIRWIKDRLPDEARRARRRE